LIRTFLTQELKTRLRELALAPKEAALPVTADFGKAYDGAMRDAATGSFEGFKPLATVRHLFNKEAPSLMLTAAFLAGVYFVISGVKELIDTKMNVGLWGRLKSDIVLQDWNESQRPNPEQFHHKGAPITIKVSEPIDIFYSHSALYEYKRIFYENFQKPFSQVFDAKLNTLPMKGKTVQLKPIFINEYESTNSNRHKLLVHEWDGKKYVIFTLDYEGIPPKFMTDRPYPSACVAAMDYDEFMRRFGEVVMPQAVDAEQPKE